MPCRKSFWKPFDAAPESPPRSASKSSLFFEPSFNPPPEFSPKPGRWKDSWAKGELQYLQPHKLKPSTTPTRYQAMPVSPVSDSPDSFCESRRRVRLDHQGCPTVRSVQILASKPSVAASPTKDRPQAPYLGPLSRRWNVDSSVRRPRRKLAWGPSKARFFDGSHSSARFRKTRRFSLASSTSKSTVEFGLPHTPARRSRRPSLLHGDFEIPGEQDPQTSQGTNPSNFPRTWPCTDHTSIQCWSACSTKPARHDLLSEACRTSLQDEPARGN